VGRSKPASKKDRGIIEALSYSYNTPRAWCVLTGFHDGGGGGEICVKASLLVVAPGPGATPVVVSVPVPY
jgi:hypothetical protein